MESLEQLEKRLIQSVDPITGMLNIEISEVMKLARKIAKDME